MAWPCRRLGGVLSDQGVEAQVLGDVPEGRDGTEVADEGGVRLVALLQASEEVVGLAEVREDDGAWLAVDAPGFNDLPVGMAADSFGHQARHEISVYTRTDKSRAVRNVREMPTEMAPCGA